MRGDPYAWPASGPEPVVGESAVQVPGAPAGVLVEAQRFWRREVELQALRGGDPSAYAARQMAPVVAGMVLAVVVGLVPTVVEMVGRSGSETAEGPGEPGPSDR